METWVRANAFVSFLSWMSSFHFLSFGTVCSDFFRVGASSPPRATFNGSPLRDTPSSSGSFVSFLLSSVSSHSPLPHPPHSFSFLFSPFPLDSICLFFLFSFLCVLLISDSYIDILWIGEDGELLVTFAHLLQRNRAWRRSRIRILSLASDPRRAYRLERGIKHTVKGLRVEAEVRVLLVQSEWLMPFHDDATLRGEQRRALKETIQRVSAFWRFDCLLLFASFCLSSAFVFV